MSLSSQKLISIGYDKGLMTDLMFCQLIDLFDDWKIKVQSFDENVPADCNVVFLSENFKSNNINSDTWIFNSYLEEENFLSSNFERRFDVNFSDSDEIKKLLDLISLSKINEKKDEFINNAYNQYKEILSNSSRYLQGLQEEDNEGTFVKSYIDLLQLGFRLSNLQSEKDVLVEINNYFSEQGLGIKLDIYMASEIDSLLMRGPDYLALPLLAGEKYISFTGQLPELTNTFSFILIVLLQELENFYGKTESRAIGDAHNLMLEEAFSKISRPVSLFSEKGELLLHNTAFSNLKLLPMECLKLEDGKQIEANEQAYITGRKDIPTEMGLCSFFIFTTEKSSDTELGHSSNLKNASSNELGIISSSIAHELNNPLAGILAATTLLELEDDWEEDSLKTLDDMKMSAGRCKELIEIFLGFSKASLKNESCQSIHSSFDQAKSLLRFRMIESSTTFELNYTCSSQLYNSINTSIITMIFYLLLSEIMTAKAHRNLVLGDSIENANVIAGSVLEENNKIIIELVDDLKLDQKLKQFKLVQHLVELEKMSLTIDGPKIVLSI